MAPKDRVFQNIDLLHQIFGHFYEYLECSESSKLIITPSPVTIKSNDLLASALTCRMFSELALNQLWWYLEDIKHLLKLIPAFQLRHGTYLLHGPITQSDLDVFNKYAKRIHYLHSTSDTYDTDSEILPSVFSRISQIKRGEPILPALQYLSSPCYGSEILAFLNPGLIEYEFQVEKWAAQDKDFYPNVLTFVDALSEVAPSLRSLSLNLQVSHECLEAVLNFKKLRHLHISQSYDLESPLNYEFVKKLSKLEYLSTLSLVGLSVPSTTSIINRFSADNFLAVKELRITTTIGQINQLLPIITNLQSLTFNVLKTTEPKVNEWKRWSRFFRLLKGTVINTLRVFPEIHYLDMAVAIDDPELDLLKLHLTHLDFQCLIIEGLCNAEMRSIIEAWPNLTSLNLTTREFNGVDFKALIEIARSLPRLRYLALQIDATEPPSIHDIPSLPFPHHLQRLDVKDSPLHDPITFARLIEAIFPYLITLDGCGPSETLWEQAGVVLGHFQDIKRRYHPSLYSSCRVLALASVPDLCQELGVVGTYH